MNLITVNVVVLFDSVHYISHGAPAGSVVSPASCQCWGGREEELVQHLWSSGAERMTETHRPHQQNEEELAHRPPLSFVFPPQRCTNWMFKD